MYYITLACTDGTFGIDCTSSCSGQCIDDSPCNKQTGYCDMGCNPGYTNIFCSGSMWNKIKF